MNTTPMPVMPEATVVIVPGLRGHVPDHWQTLLARRLKKVANVEPMGREDLDCRARVLAIETALDAIDGPVILVAHSGGCVMVAHWALATAHAGRVKAALLATPPDFDRPMPDGYPTLQALDASGWLPVPRRSLPFRSLVLASRNDPLGAFDRVSQLSDDWGSDLRDLGEVGHLNPASGFGDWPMADQLVEQLNAAD